MDISNLPTFSWFYSKIRKNPDGKEALTCSRNKLKTEERCFKDSEETQVFYHQLIFSSVTPNSICQIQKRFLVLQDCEHDVDRTDIYLPPFTLILVFGDQVIQNQDSQF